MKYFGTDGIRGEFNKTLTLELAKKVGESLSLLSLKRVLIGYDTRESNHALANAIAIGALNAGKEVIDIGIIPTPGLAYSTIQEHCLGVMITASHNPYYDNGIKIFKEGLKLQDEEEEILETFIDGNIILPTSNHKVQFSDKYQANYTSFLLKNSCKTHLKIGFDCANGATYEIAQKVFSQIVENVYFTAITPNGQNINKDVGSTHLQNICNFVINNHLDLGFAFDGDGDRVLLVDSSGVIHSGDEIIYLLAKYLKKINKLHDNKVVLTIMSNLGIESSLKAQGIEVETTTVGDRYVLEQLLLHNYDLGGEDSGHIIIPKLLPTGDGMLTSLLFLQMLEEDQFSFLDLQHELTIWPSKLVNLKVRDKNIANNAKIINTVQEINKKYAPNIRLIVRPSGTENLLRISCCMPKEKDLNEIIDYVIKIVNSL